jgi:oligopeptide transport system substrate-binding protein
MRKNIVSVLLACTVLYSCESAKTARPENNRPQIAQGGRSYGGVFRLSEAEYIKSLYPPNITDVYSYRLASQVYEGLFKFDPATLKVVKGLIEDYEIDPGGTQYTFKLKKGVYFHDDPAFPDNSGRELLAADVKYCFVRLCTQDVNNQGFTVFKDILKGANAYYEATANGKTPAFELEGIKIIDDYTIQLQLEKPSSIFLYNLARPATFIYPREAVEKYGMEMRIKAVGTGPFRITDVDEGLSIILKRHDRYHGVDTFGNPLPFLDAISVQFIKDKKTELFEFKKGNLDMLYRIPTEYIIEILEEINSGSATSKYSQYELQREPEMLTQFLSFHTQEGIFADVNVRKAFSFSIDRAKILEFVLNGEGFAPGEHGITPPAFMDYNINKLRGYTLNVDSAKYYLAKAGYPNGKGFPKITLQLNSEGERNINVAVEVQKQLKDHLNVTINLEVLPIAQVIDNAIAGNFNFLRTGWSADYPSAENFLWIFNSKDLPALARDKWYPNIFRYRNVKFDQLYDKALNSKSIEEANQYFLQAEQVLMNDAPIIVLWYDEGYRLVQSYVKNFSNNPMQYRDFSEVYFEQSKENPQGL